jgi:8-amino-7-oxononanoate synthase
LNAGQEPWQLKDPAEAGQLVDLASNDYLGLSRHPDVLAAATEAMASDGVGAGGSRLVTGTRPCHLDLEAALATWLNRDRVLLFPSGFQANIAALTALSDRHTTVLVDRLIHHSLLAGVRTSGARLQRFAHNDLEDLGQRLQRLKPATTPPLVVTESLFSMEGTSPDLQGIADLCAHHGAQLLVDEAHGLGVLGPGGRGLCHGLQQPVALVCGTFGKAFGSGGAFLAGDHTTMERLLQTSGAFRYTTALAPPLVAGAQAALHLIQTNPNWGSELSQRSERWRTALAQQGWAKPAGHGPVLPLLIGSDQDALDLQQQLEQAGLLSVAIRPPTVPEGTARLRLVLRRDLPEGTLEQLLAALGSR